MISLLNSEFSNVLAMHEDNIFQIGKINKDIYKCVAKNILTDDVIITARQIEHIESRRPGVYENFSKYLPEIIKEPDYIIESNQVYTAVILKEFSEKEKFQVVMRLVKPDDPPKYKNSIITFLRINEKRWLRYLRTKNILYKRKQI